MGWEISDDSSALSVADGLTKPLEKDAFNAFREMLRSLNGSGGADDTTGSNTGLYNLDGGL
jgi:hypothetical protein